jgi:outer membrane protein assembly factor BamB
MTLAGCGGRIGERTGECSIAGGRSNGPCATKGQDAAAPAGGSPGARDAGADDASAGHDDGDAAGASGSSSAASTDFTTFLANPAHNDVVADPALVAPLNRLWTVSVGQPVSYPLVVGNLVYVTASSTQTAHARILAFERATGAPAWRADLGTAEAGYLVYEGGRVFEVDTETSMGGGMLRAFDAVSGALDWQVQADPNEPFYYEPPVAYEGTLYTVGTGTGGRLYAYDETSGLLSWNALLYSGSAGSVAVSSDGVYVFDTEGATTAFELGGAMAWQDRPAENTLASLTPVLVGHSLYEILPQATNKRVDTSAGQTMGTFTSDLPPAFGDGMEFDVVAQALLAVSTASGATAWTFTPDGGVVTSALAVGGTVYVGSSIGTVFALDAATGAALWSENTGASFTGQVTGEAIFGMGAAHGVLVVPAGNDLVAYASAGASFDAGVREYRAGDASCDWTLVDGPPSPSTPNIPASMAVADLDGDGKPDLLTVGSYSGGGVGILLGGGDGTFRALPEMATFVDGANAVAVADVDVDGKPDVVAASSYETYDSPENVSVSRGNGDGTLQPPALYAVGVHPYAIALADFDANGSPDLAVADGSGGLRVLLNQGDGTFAAPVTYGNDALTALAAGDVNGDGKPDLALASYTPSAIQVLLGNGDGTFAAPRSNALDQSPVAVALGDVNGDGKVDIVAATSDVQVLLGHGDGTFQPAASFAAGPNPSGVAIGDVDRDGRADLVVTNEGSGSVSVLFGNGDGTFQGQVAFATGNGPNSPAIGDFNGDGQPDIATCNLDSDSVSLLLGACGRSGP